MSLRRVFSLRASGRGSFDKGYQTLWRLTHITTLVVYLEFPNTLRRFAPLMDGHERPIVKSGAWNVMNSIKSEGRERKILISTWFLAAAKATDAYLSVSKHVRVPEGDLMYITMSPRRWVVSEILAWTCSKKLTPLQWSTFNVNVTLRLGGMVLNCEFAQKKMMGKVTTDVNKHEQAICISINHLLTCPDGVSVSHSGSALARFPNHAPIGPWRLRPWAHSQTNGSLSVPLHLPTTRQVTCPNKQGLRFSQL